MGRDLLEALKIHRAIGFVWRSASRWTLISLALLILQGLIPLATLYLFKLVVDYLAQHQTQPPSTESYEYLFLLLGVGLGLALLSNLSSALVRHVQVIQTFLVADHMQRLVQSKSIDTDLAFYENSQSFDKLHRAQKESPSRPLKIVEALTELARNGLTLAAAVGVLFTFHWAAVLALLSASSPVLYYRLRHASDLYAMQREMTEKKRLSGYINRLLTTADFAKEVRAFGYGPLMARRFDELRKDLRQGMRKISAHGTRREFVTETTAAFVGYAVLATIILAALHQSITLGQIVMYLGAFHLAVGSLRPTLRSVAELYENNLFLSTLYEFLAVPRSVAEPDSPIEMPRPWLKGVSIRNLSFRYPDTDNLVLVDINLTIGPGEIVALVGKNGSGKTTLTKLLCRFYDPCAGTVTIDGVGLPDFRVADVRREMSAIYQDFGRYHFTARLNVLLGRPDLAPHDPAIVKAAKWAGIHDTLESLPTGYDTVLGRYFMGGVELSIGQWQKLALARAFVRDSQLILLDEPTSSLDAAAEFEFFEKFREMSQGRSAFIISHRFSSVRLADRIYVLDQGRILEKGSHDQLVELNGLYADLYRQQASFYGDLPSPELLAIDLDSATP